MFKMRFANLFDAYLPNTNIPAFERVKAKSENPGYNYEFAGFKSSNLNGVPIKFNGWTTLTPFYNVTVYCDVCELPVQTIKMHGVTREVHVDKYVEIQENEKLKTELQKLDGAVIFKGLSKEVSLEALYKPQCSRCGRWVAKGNGHSECSDGTYGVCKYCANVLTKLL